MNADDADPARLIAATAPLLGLEITDAQRPGVETFLRIAGTMADMLRQAPVPETDFELAPVFRPGAPGEGED